MLMVPYSAMVVPRLVALPSEAILIRKYGGNLGPIRSKYPKRVIEIVLREGNQQTDDLPSNVMRAGEMEVRRCRVIG